MALLPEIRGRSGREKAAGDQWRRLDLRQVVAGILTVTMFVMLGNMIKQEHFSSKGDTRIDTELDPAVPRDDRQELKPCWENPSSDASVNDSTGFVSFSLTNGPEFHISQVVDAVMVARYLRATLVLPDIRGTEFGEKRNFREIYDEDKFIKSLNGVVRVSRQQPVDMPNTIAVVKVPNLITKDRILETVKPIFEKNSHYIRLETYFPKPNSKIPNRKTEPDPAACLALFSTLELRTDVRETVEWAVEKMRSLNRVGKFVAVDLRPEMVGAKVVSEFLQRLGFGNDTAIYVARSRRDSGLDELVEFFPNTYTKEDVIPKDKKVKLLAPQGTIFRSILDYHVCAKSDVFIPGIPDLFYSNVAGTRIVSGRTKILVPDNIDDGSSTKNHLAYSCFC